MSICDIDVGEGDAVARLLRKETARGRAARSVYCGVIEWSIYSRTRIAEPPRWHRHGRSHRIHSGKGQATRAGRPRRSRSSAAQLRDHGCQRHKRYALDVAASIASMAPIAAALIYSTSKHAVLGLFRCLRATSHLRGIRTNFPFHNL